MAKHTVKSNVIFVSDKNDVTRAYRRGSEVELTADQAEKFEKLGALETNDDRSSGEERNAGEERSPRGGARRTAAQAATDKVEADKAEAGRE